MTPFNRTVAILMAASGLSAMAIGADVSAKPLSSEAKSTIQCIRAPCPGSEGPRVEKPRKPDIVCIRAPCPGSGGPKAEKPRKPDIVCIRAPCPGSSGPRDRIRLGRDRKRDL